MKPVFLLIFSFCCFPLFFYSQTTFKGVVKNKQGEPLIANISVQVKGSNTIAAFTSSDAGGKYNLTYKGTADTLTLIVSGMTVGKYYRIVPNRSATIDFNIEEKNLELKEIAITSTPIHRRGDTLNYIVSAYTGQNDRVIEDVLKKMPGIEVDPSGKILYNGRKINKFYIENLDLLQGRYAIATKNITAKNVASVQIYENHQPIKALKDKAFSDEAAINLKLKDEAKGSLALTAMGGVGYKPTLWNAELVAMYFTGKTQNITTYKGNNSGDDAASELRSHYDYDHVGISNSSMLSISEPSTPPVSKKRYLNNISNSITANQLFKINDKELTTNLSYYNERIKKEGYSFSEQFLPGDASIRIEEWVKNISKTNNLELSFFLNSNTSAHYLKNSLNIKGHWNNNHAMGITRSNIEDTDNTLSQILDKPVFSIDNTLNMMKNIGSKAYKLYFLITYSHKNHSLSINPANYLGNDKLTSLAQNVLSKNLESTMRGSYGLKLGNFNLDYSPWFNINLRSLDTELNSENTLGKYIYISDSLKNDLWYNTYQVGVNQTYTYKNEGGFKASLLLPIVNYTLTADDRIPDSFTCNNRWIMNPSLSASYDLTNELTASVGANFQKSYGNMNDAYTGYIMHSYRSLLRNTVDHLFETSSGGSNVSLGYRNALKALFFNLDANYKKSKKNLLYGYNYQGIMSVKTTLDQPTESENYGLRFNGSKGLLFWHTTLRAFVGYDELQAEQLIQDEILNYRSKNHYAGISVNTTPFEFMSVDYIFGWQQSRNYAQKRPDRFPSIRSHSHEAKIWFFPSKVISINLNGDYRYNSAMSNHNATFADALIRYKHEQIEWELECNNLLNAKQYVSASYSDISTHYYSYDLRPLSFLLRVRLKLK